MHITYIQRRFENKVPKKSNYKVHVNFDPVLLFIELCFLQNNGVELDQIKST